MAASTANIFASAINTTNIKNITGSTCLNQSIFNMISMANLVSCGLHYKNNMIVSDTSRVVRMTPQLESSLTIIILTTLDVSFMLLELSMHSS